MTRNSARTPTTGQDGILFPRLECWNPIEKVATIAADVNKKRVLCHISLKTLKKHFGASGDKPMQYVTEYRNAIQTAAKKIIESGNYEEDGSILIRSQDL